MEKYKLPFESDKPLLQSLLYMLIPVIMAVVSGILATVLKLEGISVRALQTAFFALAFVMALSAAKKNAGPLSNVGFSPIKNFDKWVILAILINFIIYPVNFKYGWNPDISPIYVIVSLIFSIVVGFTEETVFRGLIYRTLRHRGLGYAVFWSSFIFGAGHFSTILGGADPLFAMIQVVFAFLFGLFFVLLVVKTNSLYLPIALHSFHNFTEYMRAKLPFNEEMLFGGIACVLLLLSCIILWRSLSEEDKK